jgi:hypothetical protein
MNIGEVAGAVGAALGVAKDIVSFNKAYSEADLRLKIAELTTALASALDWPSRRSKRTAVKRSTDKRSKEIVLGQSRHRRASWI